MMKLEIQGLSKVGMVRTNNEDMISLGGVLLRDDALSFPIQLDDESQFHLLVADGMGGHEYGERASEGLLEHLCECFKQGLFRAESYEDDLRFQVRAFSERLNLQASAEGQQLPMGCTLTGVVWSQGKAYLLNAGDSRTYRFRNGILRQLSSDETLRAITGTPHDSKGLVNCIGGGCEGRLHVEDITERLCEGDLLLVCSDGLTDMVPDEDIEKVLSESEDPADVLYAMACRNGGEDNVSIIIARFLEE